MKVTSFLQRAAPFDAKPVDDKVMAFLTGLGLELQPSRGRYCAYRVPDTVRKSLEAKLGSELFYERPIGTKHIPIDHMGYFWLIPKTEYVLQRSAGDPGQNDSSYVLHTRSDYTSEFFKHLKKKPRPTLDHH